jgi:GNAT superfamily N-acetyltransferase
LWQAHIEEIRLLGSTPKAMENDHWNWETKVTDSARLISYPTMAIECSGEPQGLMLLRTDGYYARLPCQNGKPLVYVTYLATAPWNQVEIAGIRKFKGVGTLLIRAAVEMSFDVGFKGRIGLHSLPQAEAFYERHGIEFLGIDADKQHMKYFELSEQKAAEFVK